MQYHDIKSKPLVQLSKKYNISNTLEDKIHDTKISKSTDLALEENVISDSKAKKTEKRKLRSKSVCISDSILSTGFSEDVLDLYKRTASEIEKIRASDHILIFK
ncbi:3402_t:CDS:2 [Cetraspora pellucida]|uniref:3402_t:CDS:1 n=1 Tax=Cetraspora pellucida TaxID=1433469 RepID=A0A9N9EC34_9GLOM|nr:3402_t:CDS:2 [Cetraspora pellucida]